ncbi:MAG: ribose 5-phosphate isomerase B [Acidobacteria bacterium]|nr:ribose 5-phosphate isomerase B [Acidobacteriota bacterium]
MRIAIGSDHHGVTLKARIKDALEGTGLRGAAAHTCVDFGAHAGASVDYPDFARPVAEGVASGAFDRGILICSNGIGMSIAANKVPGVRAALVHHPDDAQQCREHNDANVVTLAGRALPPELALDIVNTFLLTPFAGGRHERRVAKITDLEQRSEGSA